MAITYDAPSDTITVTGYSAAVPCTPTDVYNADVGGGWGQVTRQGAAQFMVDCLLKIGDGSTATHFRILEEQLMFPTGFAAGVKLIEVKNNANFTMGKVKNAVTKSGYRGGSLLTCEATNWLYLLYANAGSNVYLYASQISSTNLYVVSKIDCRGNSTLWQVTINGLLLLTLATAAGTIDAYMITGCYARYQGSGTQEKIRVMGPINVALIWDASYPGSTTVSMTELFVRAATSLMSIWNAGATSVCNLINADCNTWTLSWNASHADARLNRQYTVNVQVFDEDGAAISNATATWYDKDNNAVFSVSTAADGTITEQTVTRGYYGSATGSVLQDNGPFRLEVSKAGKDTFILKNIVLDEPVDWRLYLATTVPTATPTGGTKVVRVPDDDLTLGFATLFLSERFKNRKLKKQYGVVD